MADPYDLRRIHPEEATGTDGGSPYRPFKPKKKPKKTPRFKQLELDLARIEKKRKSTQRVNEA